jgi:tetratricopeptide (TPR) repeat protein
LGTHPALAKEAAAEVPTGSFSGAFLAARAAEADNDLDSAIAFYRRALSFQPGNISLQRSLLLALIANGKFDESLPYAEKLKKEPEVERFSRLALAVDAFRKKDYDDAQHWLQLVLESDLDRLITGVMTSWAMAGEGRIDAALSNLDGMEGPDWYGLFVDYHRALILARADRHDDAVDAFERVIGNLPAGSGAPDTYMRAAEAYAIYLADKGERDKALNAIERSEELVKGRITTEALRERIEAGRDVKPFVSTPADGAAEILLNVAAALNAGGGGGSFAQLYLHYALALRPHDEAILIQLGSVAEQQDQPEKAIEFYKRIPEDSSLKRIVQLQIGLNLADLDRYAEAIGHLKKALTSDPDDMRAYLALGGVYASQKNFKAAAELYDRAVQRIPKPTREHWNIFYQRGIAYERLKEWEKAEPNFLKALELYPDQPQVLNYLGYSWVDMGINLEKGLELIKKAVEQRPSDGYIVDSLGWAYYRLGRYDEAVEELERAVSLKPGDPILNDHLGDAYWQVGRRLEATFQWRQARDLKPDPDVLNEIEKKLKEGLPPPKNVTLAKAPGMVDGSTIRNAVTDEAPKAAGEEPQARAPSAKKTAAPEATPASYVVQPGQTLWSIAVQELGDGDRYQEILDLNPFLNGNPDLIRPGQKLRMPAPTK